MLYLKIKSIGIAIYILLIEIWTIATRALYKKKQVLSSEDLAAAKKLRDDGYVVIPGYYDSSKVESLSEVIDKYMKDGQGDFDHINRVSYYRCPRALARWDGGVFRLFGAEAIHHLINSYRNDKRLKSIVEEAFSVPMSCDITMVQENLPIGAETRGFHIDMYAPLECKAFLFLTDVKKNEDGPYSLVRSSHRKFWWRLGNFISRSLRGTEPVTSVDNLSAVFEKDVVKLLLDKGTVVISCQQAIHRGWKHTTGRRIAIVNYYYAHLYGQNFNKNIEKRLGYNY